MVKLEENGYVEWLENMVIMLAKCYQNTHDVLLEKAKNKETDAYFSMPTVQGFEMVMLVDKISKKAQSSGTIAYDKLEGYVNYLIEEHNIKD